MADRTGIEWTDASWNPVVGCSLVSPGCTNCYAMGQAARIVRCSEGLGRPSTYDGTVATVKGRPVWTGNVALASDATLTQPLRWKRPRRIFVNSMGDLFHEDVPDAWIDRVFAVMALCPQHTFQILTKRSARMRAYIESIEREEMDTKSPRLTEAVNTVMRTGGTSWGACGSTGTHITTRLSRAGAMEALMLRSTPDGCVERLVTWSATEERWVRCGQPYAERVHAQFGNLPYPRDFGWGLKIWPLPNVWLGVSAEDQRRADERIPDLLATPAAIRFVSAEPLLGPIDFTNLDHTGTCRTERVHGISALWKTTLRPRLDWIIVGGESGPNARPMHPDWARSIRDQCAAAGTAFFFKQFGEWAPREACPGAWPNGDIGQRFDAHHFESDEGDGANIVWRVGKARAGRLLDGVTHDAMPEVRHG